MQAFHAIMVKFAINFLIAGLRSYEHLHKIARMPKFKLRKFSEEQVREIRGAYF